MQMEGQIFKEWADFDSGDTTTYDLLRAHLHPTRALRGPDYTTETFCSLLLCDFYNFIVFFLYFCIIHIIHVLCS